MTTTTTSLGYGAFIMNKKDLVLGEALFLGDEIACNRIGTVRMPLRVKTGSEQESPVSPFSLKPDTHLRLTAHSFHQRWSRWTPR